MNESHNLLNDHDKLSLDDGNPLYFQLAAQIRDKIKNGTLAEGDLLPSEPELCQSFGVSRTTVRQCFKLLEDEGLVIRRRGMGSFVSVPKVHRNLSNLYSFTRQMNEMGIKPSSRVIRFLLAEPSPEIAKELDVKTGERIFSFTRIRYANSEPQLIETTNIPESICDFLTGKMLESGSLYSILIEQAGIIPYSARETYESIILDDKISELLECSPGSCGFRICRRSVTKDNRPFEYTQSFMRGDRVTFSIDLYSENASIDRNFGKLKE